MTLTSGIGAEVIFDPVGGPMLEKLAAAAALQGMIFEYGALSPEPTPFPLFSAIGKGLTVRGYILFEIVRSPEMLARGKEFVLKGLEAGTLRPIIDRTFALADIAEAHRYMESNTQRGKIVVTV